MPLTKCCLVLCGSLLLLGLVKGAAVKQDIQEARTLLSLTLKALRRSLQFFRHEYKNVNLDAIIGTRMVDGQLKVLLRHIQDAPDAWPVSRAVVEEIADLQRLAQDVSDDAIPYVEKSQPEYFLRIGEIAKPDAWTQDFSSKDFTYSQINDAWLPQKGEAMHEDDSDNCLTELFGTGPYTNEKCHVSKGCWDLMTKRGYSGYSLSHQVFYLQIGYQLGCSEEMDLQRRLRLDQHPVSVLVDEFCASMYLEASAIAKKNYPELKRDLFMEQTAICGLMGHRWFFSPDWLMNILSWQDKETGCFKGDTILESDVEFRDTAPGRSRRSAERVKREEKIMADGCLAHRTAVASGALAEYVLFIIEYEAVTFQRQQIFQGLDEK